MCIYNTVHDVLSSHRHFQPLREAVARKERVFDLDASPGPDGAHEPQTSTWTHQDLVFGFWFFVVVVFFFFLTMWSLRH